MGNDPKDEGARDGFRSGVAPVLGRAETYPSADGGGGIPTWAFELKSGDGPCDLPRTDVSSGSTVASQVPIAPLMTIVETAALLRVSAKTVRRLIGRGDLKFVRIGRSIRLRREEIIPNPIDQNPWAHWRSPMDMMRQG